MTHDTRPTSGAQEQIPLSAATLLPPDPDAPPPGRPPARPANEVAESIHGAQVVILAVATILAIVATVGVAVLWSANRTLAAEVDAAVARTMVAEDNAEVLRTALAETPDPESLTALVSRLDAVEQRLGQPAAGTGSDDLSTRVQDIADAVDSLEDDLREERQSSNGPTSADVEAVRSDLSSLSTSVNALQRNVSTLCWALPYQDTVNASC